MRPDSETNNAFIYCLAVAAQRHGIQVLFTVAMSNHHHTGIHDPHGNYPAFLELFHKLFAKCQNTLRKRWENFWASEQTSVVRLAEGEDVLQKLAYALGNPVKAHLVERASEWPGVSSFHASLHQQPLRAKRPEHFFRKNGPMPETIELQISRPLSFEHLSHEDWRTLVTERIRVVEAKNAATRKQLGIQCLGSKRVLRQDWTATPRSNEPKRTVSPRVVAINQWRRVELLIQNKQFLRAYIEARRALLTGVSRVLFPTGTYWLARFAAAPCQPSPLLC